MKRNGISTLALYAAISSAALPAAWAQDGEQRPAKPERAAAWSRLVVSTNGYELALARDGSYELRKHGQAVKQGVATRATLDAVDVAVASERESAARPKEAPRKLFVGDWTMFEPPGRQPVSRRKFHLAVEAPGAKRALYVGRGFDVDLANSDDVVPVPYPVADLVDALEGVIDEATAGGAHREAREVTGEIGFGRGSKFGGTPPGVLTLTDDEGRVYEIDGETPYGRALRVASREWIAGHRDDTEERNKAILAEVVKRLGGSRVTLRAFVDSTTEAQQDAEAREFAQRSKADEGIPLAVRIQRPNPPPAKPLVFERLRPVRPFQVAKEPEKPSETRGVTQSLQR